MKQDMITIIEGLVRDKLYYLFDETVEEFVDRMISYGFDQNWALELDHRRRL